MDEGLLLGVIEGLKTGVSSYATAEDKRYRRDVESKKLQKEEEERQERLGLIKEQRQMEKVKLGMKKGEDGNWVEDPETFVIKKQKSDLANAETEGLLKKAQLLKTQAEASKLQKEASGEITDPKLGAEAKNKLGALTSSLQTLDELENIYKAGGKVGYVSSSTPVIGGLLSDKPVDVAIRKLSDDIGRLRSGGAINQDEESRFKNMLPRAGDNDAIAKAKIQGIRDEFMTRSGAYGVKNPQQSFGMIGKEQPKEETKQWQGKTYKRLGDKWVEQ